MPCRRHLLLAAPLLWLSPCVLLQANGLPAWRTDLPDARLLGEGAFRWLGLRIYDAQLWLDAAAAPLAATDNGWQQQRFVLALRYARAIRREQFVSATLDEIRRANPFATTAAQHQRWQDAMREVWQDVQAGDQLCALHRPGQGCRFYNQHRHLGDIDDTAFARAFFAIWLHPSTRDQALRRKLLGVA